MPRRAEAQGPQGRSWSATDATTRIGDAERRDVADALSEHYSAGRLDEGELKERLDRAMQAKTGADLASLMTDLPPLGTAPAPAAEPSRPRRSRSGLVVALVALLALMALPHAPFWWPWWMAARVPWLLVAGVAVVLWRRSRRRRATRTG